MAKSKKRPRDPATEAEKSWPGGELAAPLGDDRLPAGAGQLTADEERDGLPVSGSQPAPDGGVDTHPVHDAPREDFSPDDYEALSDDARKGGFEPRDRRKLGAVTSPSGGPGRPEGPRRTRISREPKVEDEP